MVFGSLFSGSFIYFFPATCYKKFFWSVLSVNISAACNHILFINNNFAG